jgi:hypothetical protein
MACLLNWQSNNGIEEFYIINNEYYPDFGRRIAIDNQRINTIPRECGFPLIAKRKNAYFFFAFTLAWMRILAYAQTCVSSRIILPFNIAVIE